MKDIFTLAIMAAVTKIGSDLTVNKLLNKSSYYYYMKNVGSKVIFYNSKYGRCYEETCFIFCPLKNTLTDVGSKEVIEIKEITFEDLVIFYKQGDGKKKPFNELYSILEKALNFEIEFLYENLFVHEGELYEVKDNDIIKIA